MPDRRVVSWALLRRFDSVPNVTTLSANGALGQPGSKTVWAVVPLKSPEAAKSRLRTGLNADARRRLVFAMARHVVRTLLCTPGIARVAVVTASPEVAAWVAQEGATVIRQERDAGMAEACRSAVAQLSASADSLLMISGDLTHG